MLDRSLLGEVTTVEVSGQTGISEARLEQILAGDQIPSLFELSKIADALSINPMYLTRPRPAIVASRDSGVDSTDLDDLLERFDYHVAAFRRELAQLPVAEAFPAATPWAARTHGEAWAGRNDVEWAGPSAKDALVQAVEERLRIPVLIWPVRGGPFGATLRLDETLAIWVNSYDVPGSQQRFTLAHELGHIFLKHTEHTVIEQALSPDRAAAFGSQTRRKKEEHANAFAGGVLYSREGIASLWDGHDTPASIARVATGLGISYDAASVAMSIHLRGQVDAIRDICRTTSAARAFAAAGESDTFDWFEEQRDRRRVPSVVEHAELLAESLELAVPS